MEWLPEEWPRNNLGRSTTLYATWFLFRSNTCKVMAKAVKEGIPDQTRVGIALGATQVGKKCTFSLNLVIP